MARRLAFKPIANLFAFIIIVGFNILNPGIPEILLLVLFIIYVAASHFLPRPANARKAAQRYHL